MIRLAFIIIFALLIVTLIFCALASYRSGKTIGNSVCLFCLALVPPLLGNAIIIGSRTRIPAYTGCYIYYIGMDLIMYTLTRFTNEYCRGKDENTEKHISIPAVIDLLLAIDAIQLLLNIPFGHAFSLQEIEVYGKPYYIMNPLSGQTFHRIICYGVMAMVMLVFIARSIQVPRLYKERYIVILMSMIISTLWQTFYIFSQTPIDRSMIGFAVFGLLIYYFSIHYRPLRLLDSMLASIVSDTREAVILYGPEGRSIWANEPAKILSGITKYEPEASSNALITRF